VSGITIGIDARAAAEEPSGRGRFVRELLRHLGRRNDPNRYLLYARRPWDEPLDERFEWRLVDRRDPWWHLHVGRRANGECGVFLSSNSYLTAWLTRIPTAVVVYDLVAFVSAEHTRRSSGRIERATIRPALRRASLLICISEATARDLVSRFPVARGKTTVVPLAADERFAADMPQARLERAREAYELPESFVFAVGTIEPRKNLGRVIAAWRQLPAGATALAIAGPLGWEFEEVVGDARAAGDVRLLGHVPDDDLAALYRLCTVFCYPSLYEGFGLPLLEAMAAGAACVTSNVSSLPEVGGDAVLYVDPRRVGELGAVLGRLLASDDERQALGARARERARLFSWQRTADEIARQLEMLAATRS
jgi:alpha-1,3-rhamnosyl/mannosyltransferase